MAWLYFVTEADHAADPDSDDYDRVVPSTIPDEQKIHLTEDIKVEHIETLGDTNIVSEPEIDPNTKDNHFQEVGIIEKGIVVRFSASTNNLIWDKLLKIATAFQLDFSDDPSDDTIADFSKGRVGFVVDLPSNEKILDSNDVVESSTKLFNITPDSKHGYIMRWPIVTWDAPSSRMSCVLRLISANRDLVTEDADI